MKNTLIILLGPTGIGKTDLAIDIALYLNTEIISCDSRQFYRELSTGTAIPSASQLEKVKHHFIQHLSVDDYYSASNFEQDFIELIRKLFRDHNTVLMTGGSGLYIDAACGRIDDIPDVDPDVREKYNRKYKEEGLESIRQALSVLDPDYYRSVDLRNPKRMLRALEICETTGRPYSHFLHRKGKSRDFNILKIGLHMDRRELYERINRRVDIMIDKGLEEEARRLLPRRHNNALNTVGYKEFFMYFDGEISRDKAIELIKRNSRRYAKRQMTWWAKDSDIEWFHPSQKDDILDYIRKETADADSNST
ncbi:MAG: tRNA (adenosine(37)-N6)-dimethylallyltransferase MiaA [Bacteroidales bacterium]|nr:tRNA (adenosine(37)-N6)-dimethylallyltransferase MiaA [Bacteroidales bacterium]